MKWGQAIVFGLVSLALFGKVAGAGVFNEGTITGGGKVETTSVSPTQENIVAVCDVFRETHRNVDENKCLAIRESCEGIIQDGLESRITECFEIRTQCELLEKDGVCFQTRVPIPGCQENLLSELIKQYEERIGEECGRIPPEIPTTPVDPKDPPKDPVDPKDPIDPKDPVDPKDPGAGVEVPPQDTNDNDAPFVDGVQNQVAPRPTLELRGGGCSLSSSMGSAWSWLNVMWLLVPALATVRRK